MNKTKNYTKQLFTVEAIIGIAATIFTIAMIVISAFIIDGYPLIAAIIIAISIVSFIIICLGLTKMEQIVGYYQCAKCRHKHVPTYNAVLWSMHFGRTRHLSCPKCHKKSWQKKVL